MTQYMFLGGILGVMLLNPSALKASPHFSPSSHTPSSAGEEHGTNPEEKIAFFEKILSKLQKAQSHGKIPISSLWLSRMHALLHQASFDPQNSWKILMDLGKALEDPLMEEEEEGQEDRERLEQDPMILEVSQVSLSRRGEHRLLCTQKQNKSSDPSLLPPSAPSRKVDINDSPLPSGAPAVYDIKYEMAMGSDPQA